MKTLGQISDSLLSNTNINISKADDSWKQFLWKNLFSSKSVSTKSDFNFKCKFIPWHLSISFYISCNFWRLYKKLISWFIIIQILAYACYHCISYYKRKLILKSSPLIIISSDASYENSVLFCEMWQLLNLISISKLMGICFAMLLQFSKPEILNYKEYYLLPSRLYGHVDGYFFNFVIILLIKFYHLSFKNSWPRFRICANVPETASMQSEANQPPARDPGFGDPPLLRAVATVATTVVLWLPSHHHNQSQPRC